MMRDRVTSIDSVRLSSWPLANASRRSSRTQYSVASTPRTENEDWPSAPDLLLIDQDDVGSRNGDVDEYLDFHLAQKTMAMLALIRENSPDKVKGKSDVHDQSNHSIAHTDKEPEDDQQDISYSHHHVEEDDDDVHSFNDEDDLQDEKWEEEVGNNTSEVVFELNEDDYLVGGDFIEVPSPKHQATKTNPKKTLRNQESDNVDNNDDEEDIFGMEL
eukprot:scaffold27_cov182-Ochromonas_danica.AAC.2